MKLVNAIVRFVLVCATLSWLPLAAQTSGLRTVFLIVAENHRFSQIKGSANAPYINNTLLPQASYAEQYFTPPGNHPSLPNYLWLEAGRNFGIADNNSPRSNHQRTTAHLVTQLRDAGISWKTYQEDIRSGSCPLTDVDLYVSKHNPFIYFDDVSNLNDTSSAYCVAHVRPFAELATDLQSNNLPQYVFITPNLCNSGHDACPPLFDSIRQTDIWLAANVPAILNSKAYQNGGALFLTWDEGDGDADGPIGMLVLSPYAKGGGYSNTIRYSHGSLLRTVEEIFGVSLIADAASQTNLSDLFKVPVDLTATGGNKQVALRWSPVPGAAGFNVKRGTVNGGPYGIVVGSGITATNFADTTVSNGPTYYYTVTTVNGSSEGLPSNQAAATPAPVPTVSAPLNAASFRSPGVVSAGAILSVFGTGFGTQDNYSVFPATAVNGVRVQFGTTPAPVFAFAATGGQINVLAPTDLPSTGTVSLTVQNPAGLSASQTVTLAPATPGIFFYSDPGVSTRRNAVAVAANTAWIAMPTAMAARMNLPTNCGSLVPAAVCGQPAHRGDYVQIYVTGLGQATPNGDPSGTPLQTGNVAPLNGRPVYLTTATPTVTIGGQAVDVLFSGLSPGYTGLYQVNVQIPSSIASGDDVPIQISMGALSDSATIAVQ